MKDDLNCSHNGGTDAYLLQSVYIHFNHTVKFKWMETFVPNTLKLLVHKPKSSELQTRSKLF